MKGRNALLLILAGLSLFLPLPAEGTTRYVANTLQFGNSPLAPYDNPFFAAGSVQDALNLSVAGDTVLVAGIPFSSYLASGRSYQGSASIPMGVTVLGGWNYGAATAGFPSNDQRLFQPDSLWTFLVPGLQRGVTFHVDSVDVYDTSDVGGAPVIDTSSVLVGPDSTTVFSGFVVYGVNVTGKNGGGIYIRSGSPTITRNVLVDCKTSARGGAIFVGNGSPIIENNTVALIVSDANAGAVHIAGGSPRIRDNVFFGTADGYAVACSDSAGSPLISYNVFYDNNGNDTFGCGGDGTNLFDTDPVFCNDVDQDFRIFQESSIIGVGWNGGIPGAWGIGCRAGTKYVSILSGRDLFPYDQPDKAATSITDVLAITSPGDTIRVAVGTYVENIVIPAGIVFEGGWEANFNQRDPFQQGTIIRPATAGSPAITMDGVDHTVLSYVVLTGAMDGDGALFRIDEGSADLDHFSVVGNDASAAGSLVLVGASAQVNFRYGMLAMNDRAPVFECGGGLTVTGCNFYMNDHEFATGCTPAISDTSHTKPFFCDAAGGDWRFYSEGSLNAVAPGGTPLGALSIGCNYRVHYIRVDAGAGVFPYETPDHATSDIAGVISMALVSDSIRFTSGTYDVNVVVTKGVFLEGGWSDSTFSSRNHATYPTILRGVTAGEPTVTFNGYASQFSPPGGLDGFFITHAEGVDGPGVVIKKGARPVLRRNTIYGNRVDFAASHLYRAAGLVVQGASADSQSVATILNNTIVSNRIDGAAAADTAAGGVYSTFAGVGSNDKFRFYDNIVAYNAGGKAGLVSNVVWLDYLRNIAYGNTNADGLDTLTTQRVSLSAFINFTTSQIDVKDPRFCDPIVDDYRLSTCSPAIVSATGDTVIGALRISSRCICDNEVFLVNPLASSPGFPFSSRNSASRKVSWLDSLLTSGDTVKVAAGSFEDEFTLTGGVVYKGGYNVATFREDDRGKISRIGGNSAHRVIFGGDGVDSLTWIDGLNIGGGHADLGGAILLMGNATPLFTNCQILESRADVTGGAVLAIENAAPRFDRVQFHHNSAHGGGAIIHFAGGGGLLSRSTIVNNFGGWAVWIDSCAPEIYNNSITYNDYGVRSTGGAGSIFDHNNVFLHDVDYEIDIDTSGQGNISNGPLYCDRVQRSYTIFDHSPNVAAGRNGTNIGALGVRCSTPRHFVSVSGSNTYPYDTAAKAAHNLQDALDVASLAGFSNPADSTDEVRVAAGTYEGTFRLPTNVRVIGGYNSFFGTSDPRNNRTIIDAGGQGTAVVVDSGAGGVGRNITRLSGFVIQNGEGDQGGGVRVEKDARPRIESNIIRDCRATLGGGIYSAAGALPRVTRNLIYLDTAEVGAGLYMDQGYSASATVCTLNTFVENFCSVDTGGVVHLIDSNPRFAKNVVANSTGGGAFHLEGLWTPVIKDNLFWANAGGDTLPIAPQGAHVIADPRFCDPGAERFGVFYDSERINAGLSPVRDLCAVTVWGSEGVGCTTPGHRFLVYWDPNNNNTPVYPYVCSNNAARLLSSVLDRVNPGDTVDVAGSGPNNEMPLDGAIYDGVLTLDRPIVFRGGFDAGFSLEYPRPDSFDLRTVIAAPGWRSNLREEGTLLTIEQSPDADTDPSLVIDSSTVISGFVFMNGRAELQNGGAIRVRGGAGPTIRDNWFEGNATKNWGGAISLNGAHSPRIYNNYFYRNSAGVGGAIYVYQGTDPVIRRNVMAENSADQFGGIRLEQLASGASVDNNVIRKNAGGGVSLSNPQGDVAIRNNVVTQNGGYGVSLTPYFEGIRKPVLSHNDVWANSAGQYLNVDAGEGAISTAPFFCNVDALFGRATRDFYKYQECSPLLYAGSDPTSDLDAHIGAALRSDPVCADTVRPTMAIGFIMNSTIPGIASVYVIPSETIARDSMVLRLMYANEEQEEVVIGEDTLLVTVYNFDSTLVNLIQSDPGLSVYRSDNIELRTADTLIVEARAVDLCGKVGTARRFFASHQFVKGKAGSIRSTDRRALVEVPGDAFRKSGLGILEVVATPEGFEQPLVGAYALEIGQIELIGTATLSVSVGGIGVRDEDLTGLALYRLERDRWVLLDSKIDPESREVRAEIVQGGTYGVFHSADVRSETVVPKRFALYANAPNPFNPVTNIAFDIPAPVEVSLRVYDVRGRQIRVLEDGNLPAGRYNYVWDGKDDHDRSVGSGLYFYRLTAGDREAVRKMMLVR